MRDRPVILVTGGSGQVGFELLQSLAPLGVVVAPTRGRLDLARPSSIRIAIRAIRPAVIVNAGAYTAVDRAESERAMCFAINRDAPAVLAEEARRAGAGLIHYSTDYVFDGTKGTPYVETDVPSPINVYGESKLQGELATSVVEHHLILRTSWVYGSHRSNFVSTIGRVAHEHEVIRVVDDQWGTPTWSRWIATATARMLRNLLAHGPGDFLDAFRGAAGTYHLTLGGATSRFELAVSILDFLRERGRDVCGTISPVSTTELLAAARRPQYSVLNNSKAERWLGQAIPHWNQQLRYALSELDERSVQPTGSRDNGKFAKSPH